MILLLGSLLSFVIAVSDLSFFTKAFYICPLMLGTLIAAGWQSDRERRKNFEAASLYDPEPNWRGRFASEAELEAAGAFENKSGICMGVSRESGREIYYNPKHMNMIGIVTLGGMNSMKTNGMHIPLALRWGLED